MSTYIYMCVFVCVCVLEICVYEICVLEIDLLFPIDSSINLVNLIGRGPYAQLKYALLYLLISKI